MTRLQLVNRVSDELQAWLDSDPPEAPVTLDQVEGLSLAIDGTLDEVRWFLEQQFHGETKTDRE